MSENYFIVYSTQDTMLAIDGPLSKKEVSYRLDEEHYGDLKIYNDVDDLAECGKGCGKGLVIIEGKVVVPKPVEVVKRYEF